MNKTILSYLRDILQELSDIIEFTVEGEVFFRHDVKTQKAVIRSYEVIGGICKPLPGSLRQAHPEIDWRKLIRFRDYLAHNYEYIALRYVWDANEMRLLYTSRWKQGSLTCRQTLTQPERTL